MNALNSIAPPLNLEHMALFDAVQHILAHGGAGGWTVILDASVPNVLIGEVYIAGGTIYDQICDLAMSFNCQIAIDHDSSTIWVKSIAWYLSVNREV